MLHIEVLVEQEYRVLLVRIDESSRLLSRLEFNETSSTGASVLRVDCIRGKIVSSYCVKSEFDRYSRSLTDRTLPNCANASSSCSTVTENGTFDMYTLPEGVRDTSLGREVSSSFFAS